MKHSVLLSAVITLIVLTAIVAVPSRAYEPDNTFLSHKSHDQSSASGDFMADFGALDDSTGTDFAFSAGSSTYLYYNASYGAFYLGDSLSECAGQILRVADMDNDGYDDIVGMTSSYLKLFMNDSSSPGTFTYRQCTSDSSATCHNYNPVRYGECEDVDGDGDRDCIRWHMDGTYMSFMEFDADEDSLVPSSNDYCIEIKEKCTMGCQDGAVTDIDHDTDLDILTANGEFFGAYNGDTTWASVFTNNGSGVFSYTDTIQIDTADGYGWYAHYIEAGLLNGDNHVDAVVSRSKGGVSDSLLLYDGDTSGVFTYSQSIATNGTSWLELADVDNDGDIDIIEGAKDSIVVHYNNGSGDFGTKKTIVPADSTFGWVYFIQCADVDADGDIDLLVSDNASHRIAWVFYNHTYADSSQGDCDSNNVIDVWDLVYLSLYLEGKGPAPKPWYSGDCDFNGVTDADDVTYLSNYIFSSGPRPIIH